MGNLECSCLNPQQASSAIAEKIQNFFIKVYLQEINNQQKLHFLIQNKESTKPQIKIFSAKFENSTFPTNLYSQLTSYESKPHLNSIEDYFCKLKQFKSTLKFSNNFQLQFKPQEKSQSIKLSLIFSEQQSFHKSKIIKNQKYSIVADKQRRQSPYFSIVRIVSKFQFGEIHGTGVITGKNEILTVAHNVYLLNTKSKNKQALSVYVYVLTLNNIEEQLKVKNFTYQDQYKFTGLEDNYRYDFVYLTLQQNSAIQNGQILQIKWNWSQNQKEFSVLGFPYRQNKCVQLSGKEFVHIDRNFLYYSLSTKPGMCGGPVLVKQNNKFYIIGLHQGDYCNVQKAILCHNFEKNSQIKKQSIIQIDFQQKILQNFLNQKINKQQEVQASSYQEQCSLKKKLNQLYLEGKKYFQKEQYQIAKKELQQYKLIWKKYKKEINILKQVLQLLGKIYFKQDNFQISLKHFKLCQKINQKQNQPLYQSQTLFFVGKIYFKQKKFREAIAYFKEILKILALNNLKKCEIQKNVLFFLSQGLYQLKQYSKALKKLQELKNIYRNDNQMQTKNYAYCIFLEGKIFQNKRDYYAAYNKYEKSVNIMGSKDLNNPLYKQFVDSRNQIKNIISKK